MKNKDAGNKLFGLMKISAGLKGFERIGLVQTESVIPNPLPGSTEQVLEATLPAYFVDPRFDIPEELKKTTFHEETYEQIPAAVGNWDCGADVKTLTHRS